MRLVEMRSDRIPKRAGKAVIEYTSVEFPQRKGKVIQLPEYSPMEMFRLQDNWNQFLILVRQEVYFGGTDENPFLVRMAPEIIGKYLEGGPSLFYEELIPPLMEELAKMFPGLRYKRQGDIFAFPLPYTWKEIARAFEICHWVGLKPEEGKISLLNTRHSLQGTYFSFGNRNLLGSKVTTIVEGKVSAPDHSVMVLEGLHTVAQTSRLYSPKEAD